MHTVWTHLHTLLHLREINDAFPSKPEHTSAVLSTRDLPLKPLIQLSRISIAPVQHGNFSSTCSMYTDKAAAPATKKCICGKAEEKWAEMCLHESYLAGSLCSEDIGAHMRRVFTQRRGSRVESCRGVSHLKAQQIAGCSNVSLSPIWFSFFSLPPKSLRGNGARTGEENEEVEEVKEMRMEEAKGGGGGEERLRREQSAVLVCCGLTKAALGSAFAPLLQQCEASARAACCSHRFTAKQGHGFLCMLDSGFCSSAA